MPLPVAAPLPTTRELAARAILSTSALVSQVPVHPAVSVTQPQQKEEPLPVTQLKAIFARSETGQKILQRPNRCMFSKPSPEATDAYDLEVVKAIRNNEIEKLRALQRNGKSLDACNRFGESLIHMACRRSDLGMVKFLVEEAGVRVDVRDDFGRLPLHDACWTTLPNFEVMDVLIKASSPALLLSEDVRGHTPYHYARREHWTDWVQFLNDRDQLISQRLLFSSHNEMRLKTYCHVNFHTLQRYFL
jgi:ankyrin repeat protein